MTIVIFGSEGQYVRTVCNALDQAFGPRLNFVFANEQVDKFSDLITEYDVVQVTISLSAVCAGLRSFGQENRGILEILMPDFDGGETAIPLDRARWIEEELEIVHKNIGTGSDSPDADLRDFLIGHPISWYGLNIGIDVGRTMTPRLQQQVISELSSRTTRRLNLWHWPGGGGTTVGRRVAWDLHAQFPTVLAKRVVPDAMIERLQFLFSSTRLPLLVLVEDAVTTKDEIDRVYERARSANIAVVFLQIRRSERPHPQESGIREVNHCAGSAPPDSVLLCSGGIWP